MAVVAGAAVDQQIGGDDDGQEHQQDGHVAQISTVRASAWSMRTRSVSARVRTRSRARSTSCCDRSMPTARQPNLAAAPVTSRPSPQPTSMRRSPFAHAGEGRGGGRSARRGSRDTVRGRTRGGAVARPARPGAESAGRASSPTTPTAAGRPCPSPRRSVGRPGRTGSGRGVRPSGA